MKKVDALESNLKRINSDIKIEKHPVRLNPENIPKIFTDCQVIVEAFDLAEMKQMLIETLLEKLPQKYIVSGVGMAGWGDNNSIKMVQHDKLFICGDGTSEISDILPPLAPRVGIVANMQANQVLEILLNSESL
jgi:sulfur carrier protein ThiS adenylyltransferase